MDIQFSSVNFKFNFFRELCPVTLLVLKLTYFSLKSGYLSFNLCYHF